MENLSGGPHHLTRIEQRNQPLVQLLGRHTKGGNEGRMMGEIEQHMMGESEQRRQEQPRPSSLERPCS